MLPDKLQALVRLLARLPGVGDKTAQRYALFLCTADPAVARELGLALASLEAELGPCTRCGHVADRSAAGGLCSICADPRRDGSVLCVVGRVQDLLSIERSAAYRGRYFVLGRLLAPLEGIRAEDLPLERLKDLLRDPARPVTEVLLATPPSVDGEATALLLAEELRPLGIRVTRLASGVPHGGDLEFADPVTIGRAIAHRRGLE
ncbi:MAG: recombination protein RecR [Polyangiaceae bacterium]|nr:recombination protein RecR [Polyangiaceae bacterium]